MVLKKNLHSVTGNNDKIKQGKKKPSIINILIKFEKFNIIQSIYIYIHR